MNNHTPATAFILSAEDSPQTIISRLASAGADPNFIQILDPNLSLAPPKPRSAHARPPTASLIRGLTDNLPKTKNPRLLIIDPLPAFLGTLDCPNPATIRRTLRPLLDLAHQHHLAILGLTHLNKSPTPSKDKNNTIALLHRILGSLAYPALARSILLLAPDPQLPDRRILSQLKNNLGPLLPPLAFSISSTPIGPTLDWEPEPLADSPSPAPDESEDHDPFAQSQLDEALNFLTTTLHDGPVPSMDLLKQSRSLGIAPRTLARARFQLQTRSFHHPETNQWLISLP